MAHVFHNRSTHCRRDLPTPATHPYRLDSSDNLGCIRLGPIQDRQENWTSARPEKYLTALFLGMSAMKHPPRPRTFKIAWVAGCAVAALWVTYADSHASPKLALGGDPPLYPVLCGETSQSRSTAPAISRWTLEPSSQRPPAPSPRRCQKDFRHQITDVTSANKWRHNRKRHRQQITWFWFKKLQSSVDNKSYAIFINYRTKDIVEN